MVRLDSEALPRLRATIEFLAAFGKLEGMAILIGWAISTWPPGTKRRVSKLTLSKMFKDLEKGAAPDNTEYRILGA